MEQLQSTSKQSASASQTISLEKVAPANTQLALSGLEPLVITKENPFILIGERTNVTGSPKFRKLIEEGKYEEALSVARQQVESGANIIDVNFDEGLLDSEACMTKIP